MLFRRLSTTVLLLSLALAHAPAQTAASKAQEDRDLKEMQAYTLTMDLVTRTTIAMNELTKLPPSSAPKDSDADGDKQQTLDGMAATLDKSPQALAIIKSHGLTSRTLALTFMTMLQTGIAVAALDSGAKLSDILATGQVNAANIALFREHKAELDALGQKYPMKSE